MAKLMVGSGLDAYIATLEQLTGPALDADMKRAIYEGAGVMMDAVKAEVNVLPVYSGYKRGTPESKIEGVSAAQKKGLMNGLGISRMRYDGDFLNAKIGADGYNGIKTKRWPQGQPNAMVVRSLEAGTSFLKRSPIITRAVRKARAKTEKTIADAYDKALRQRLGGINNG